MIIRLEQKAQHVNKTFKMTRIILLIFLTISLKGFAQTQKGHFPLSVDTSFNAYIFSYIKEKINLEEYDTLCIEACTFVRFKAGNKKVSSLKFSNHTPGFLKKVLEQAILSSAKLWSGSATEEYLLPIVYIFENNCKPTNRSSTSVLQILHDLSENPKANSFPGFGNDTPIRCIILNPLFLKSHYD